MEEVFYQGEAYYILHKYDSGYWEIKSKRNRFDIILIHKSEAIH